LVFLYVFVFDKYIQVEQIISLFAISRACGDIAQTTEDTMRKVLVLGGAGLVGSAVTRALQTSSFGFRPVIVDRREPEDTAATAADEIGVGADIFEPGVVGGLVRRHEAVAVIDTVNIASRLQGKAAGYEIVMTEEVYRRVGDRFGMAMLRQSLADDVLHRLAPRLRDLGERVRGDEAVSQQAVLRRAPARTFSSSRKASCIRPI